MSPVQRFRPLLRVNGGCAVDASELREQLAFEREAKEAALAELEALKEALSQSTESMADLQERLAQASERKEEALVRTAELVEIRKELEARLEELARCLLETQKRAQDDAEKHARIQNEADGLERGSVDRSTVVPTEVSTAILGMEKFLWLLLALSVSACCVFAYLWLSAG